ncbi:unnamed protein product [Linum tenue]|uniref:DYW domain-containing protein n=1 Tax=Linum tenue TaxID=586396 RepID=A0AAV0H687_9ROSI|nr:unnamed protein product [Linum tenue]
MKTLAALPKQTSAPAKLISPSTAARTPTRIAPAVSTESQFVPLIHASKVVLHLRQIHAQILLQGFSWSSLLATQLVSASSLRNAIDYSISVFSQYHPKNVFLFNALIRGLVKNARFEVALSHFVLMLRSDARPDRMTYPFVLKSTAQLFLRRLAGELHCMIFKTGVELDSFVEVSLADMYVKIEELGYALKVFDESPHRLDSRSTLLWNVLINGCCKKGDIVKAMELFHTMPGRGIKPDEVVFLALLTACTHAGQVDLGLNIFDSMRLDYQIDPSMKHYSLIVDLLGRAGRLNEALKFIEEMPINPDLVIWGTLFCACRAHKNVEIAEFAVTKLLELEPKHPGSYVFLSNAYAAVGRWEDAERVRSSMQDKGVGKGPGWSHVEVDGQVHRFVAGDNAHHKDANEIHQKLEEIMSGARKQGYMPGTEWVLHNIEEEEKEDALGSHSEKLALAFALIQTSPKTAPIRIVKNLRICGDCHSLMKYASIMSQREIIVRDIKRFHHFKDGTCSCGDYW